MRSVACEIFGENCPGKGIPYKPIKKRTAKLLSSVYIKVHRRSAKIWNISIKTILKLAITLLQNISDHLCLVYR